MTNKQKLLAGAALALALGIGAAVAQSGGSNEPNARTQESAKQDVQSAQVDKRAPTDAQAPATHNDKSVRKVGPAGWPEAKPGAAAKPPQTSVVKSDPLALDKRATPEPKPQVPQQTTQQTGAKPQENPQETTGSVNAAQSTNVIAPSATNGQPQTFQPAQTTQAPAEPKQESAASIRLGTDASGRVVINQDQEKQIAGALRKQRVNPVTVDFAVKVGIAVPASVELGAVSADIVEVLPQFRGYSYFATADEIVIVEPRDKKIVALLPVSLKAVAAKPVQNREAPARAASRPLPRGPGAGHTVTVTTPRGPVHVQREVTVGSSLRDDDDDAVVYRRTVVSPQRVYRVPPFIGSQRRYIEIEED